MSKDASIDKPIRKFASLSIYQALIVAICTGFGIMFVPSDFIVANLPVNIIVGLFIWSALLGFCYHRNAMKIKLARSLADVKS